MLYAYDFFCVSVDSFSVPGVMFLDALLVHVYLRERMTVMLRGSLAFGVGWCLSCLFSFCYTRASGLEEQKEMAFGPFL